MINGKIPSVLLVLCDYVYVGVCVCALVSRCVVACAIHHMREQLCACVLVS